MTDIPSYPMDDDDWRETTIAEVKKWENSWELQESDHTCFLVKAADLEKVGVVPAAGMTARYYPGGRFRLVRGLFLDGQRIFYRNPDADKEYQKIQQYGTDAAEWLKRWDAGDIVWTVEMGGLGPGYEQAIQITVAEMLRYLLSEPQDTESWKDEEKWPPERDRLYEKMRENQTVNDLGLSGAQAGSALSLAVAIYLRGPRDCIDQVPKYRQIMVSKGWPKAG